MKSTPPVDSSPIVANKATTEATTEATIEATSEDYPSGMDSNTCPAGDHHLSEVEESWEVEESEDSANSKNPCTYKKGTQKAASPSNIRRTLVTVYIYIQLVALFEILQFPIGVAANGTQRHNIFLGTESMLVELAVLTTTLVSTIAFSMSLVDSIRRSVKVIWYWGWLASVLSIGVLALSYVVQDAHFLEDIDLKTGVGIAVMATALLKIVFSKFRTYAGCPYCKRVHCKGDCNPPHDRSAKAESVGDSEV